MKTTLDAAVLRVVSDHQDETLDDLVATASRAGTAFGYLISHPTITWVLLANRAGEKGIDQTVRDSLNSMISNGLVAYGSSHECRITETGSQELRRVGL